MLQALGGACIQPVLRRGQEAQTELANSRLLSLIDSV